MDRAVEQSKFEEKMASAKSALAETSQPLLVRTRKTVAGADDHVRANPWSAVGVAVIAGVVVGFLAARR